MDAEAQARLPRLPARALIQRLRVCFLTHYFPPEAGAPQTRIELLARTLAQRGARVTVHTGFPHYPSGGVRAPYHNRPWLREHRNGVSIVRSAVYPAANVGVAPRLADHAAFALSALATAWLTGPADVVIAETPPLFTAAAGAAYASLKRAAYVVNVADQWPASAVQLGVLRQRHAITAASWLERLTYRRADRITAPTCGIVTALAAVAEAGTKARRLWPVVDIDRFDPRPPVSAHRPSDSAGERGAPLRLLYAGTLGLAQGLDVLVHASRLAGPDVVQTTIAGDGAEAGQLRALVHREGVRNVRLLGSVDAARVPGLYTSCDAAAVLLRDLPIFRGALPTKLLEAMAAGRPLLLAARGESAELVRAAGAGLVVAPGDPAALAQACRQLMVDPARRLALGRAGRAYAVQHFGAQRAASAWEAALSDVVCAHRAARSRSARRFWPAAGARRQAD